MQKEFIFVEVSRGEYEGQHYNNVRLSDGVETMKVKNKTGNDFDTFKRGDKIKCTFDILPRKGDLASVVLVGVSPVK